MLSISLMLAKTNIKLGSVQLGQKYAAYYKLKFEELLNDKYINNDILIELKEQVVKDYKIIKEDCFNRVMSHNIIDNKNMISMILDFILTLKV